MMQTLVHDDNNFTPSPNKSPSTRYLNKSSDLQPLIDNNYKYQSRTLDPNEDQIELHKVTIDPELDEKLETSE